MPENLYFVIYKDFFKIGVSFRVKKRIEQLANEYEGEILFGQSFYIESSETIARALEMSLKNKYNHIPIEGFYVTECFSLDDLESMKKDINLFFELFKLNGTIKYFSEKYNLLLYDSGRYHVKSFKELDAAKKMEELWRKKKLEKMLNAKEVN